MQSHNWRSNVSPDPVNTPTVLVLSRPFCSYVSTARSRRSEIIIALAIKPPIPQTSAKSRMPKNRKIIRCLLNLVVANLHQQHSCDSSSCFKSSTMSDGCTLPTNMMAENFANCRSHTQTILQIFDHFLYPLLNNA